MKADPQPKTRSGGRALSGFQHRWSGAGMQASGLVILPLSPEQEASLSMLLYLELEEEWNGSSLLSTCFSVCLFIVVLSPGTAGPHLASKALVKVTRYVNSCSNWDLCGQTTEAPYSATVLPCPMTDF